VCELSNKLLSNFLLILRLIFENESVRDLADVALMERTYLLFLIENTVPDMTMQEMNFSASDIVLCDSFVTTR
jgi:hypothetical protein